MFALLPKNENDLGVIPSSEDFVPPSVKKFRDTLPTFYQYECALSSVSTLYGFQGVEYHISISQQLIQRSRSIYQAAVRALGDSRHLARLLSRFHKLIRRINGHFEFIPYTAPLRVSHGGRGSEGSGMGTHSA